MSNFTICALSLLINALNILFDKTIFIYLFIIINIKLLFAPLIFDEISLFKYMAKFSLLNCALSELYINAREGYDDLIPYINILVIKD